MANSIRRTSVRLSAVLLVLAGCSGEPHLYNVKGAVTYGDDPVPAGIIYFDPVAGKNSGPQGFAEIKDGFFDTAQKGGRGVTGGPYIARIYGADGKPKNEQPLGTTLFEEYSIEVDLPKSHSEQKLEVPKQKK